MDIYIFGAKATAAGLYKALSVLEPEKKIKAFLVTDAGQNVHEIWGCPVRALAEVSEELSDCKKAEVTVYAAVPELIHKEVEALLEGNGFTNLIMLDSVREADIMGQYFQKEGRFLSVHSLGLPAGTGAQDDLPKLTVYAASFYKDKQLESPPQMPSYVKKLYLGCDGAVSNGIDISGQADFYDHTGDNISGKNPNRCEMTAHYWVWKNRLHTEDEYVGICHYRRTLDLSEEDLRKIKANDADIVLPYPMIHYPAGRIHHTWYVAEKDWKLMRHVVGELYPDYLMRFDEVFDASEFYNYNMMLAKKQVFADYCAWLYPILDRIEELSEPKGADRCDRYTAYMSESLETLYFMINRKKLKIYHTGRILYR